MELTDYGFVLVGRWQECDRVLSGVRFLLTQYQQARVLYAFVVDGSPKYIGICENDKTTLKKRMENYKSRCGGVTNRSNAQRIRQCLQDGQTVEIYALQPEGEFAFADLQFDLVKALENPLIAKFKPEWNGKTVKIEVERSEL